MDFHTSPGVGDGLHGRKIAAPDPVVLPAMPPEVLADALRRLPREEFDIALRDKVFPLVNLPGMRLYAACGRPAAHRATACGKKLVALVTMAAFHDAIHKTHAQHLLREATYWLARARPVCSASRRFIVPQAVAAAILGLVTVTLAVVLPGGLAWLLASLVAALFFLAVIALRVLCLLPHGAVATPARRSLSDDDLPAYSVLVPVFRETAVLGQLLNGLCRIDYPALGSKRTK